MNPTGSSPRNHYDLLEVSQNASPEVLRAAYKSLIQRYHPDRNPGDAGAAERSTQVVKAYQVLSDPVERAIYDLELKRQSDHLLNLGSRRRDLLVSAASRGKTKEVHWLSFAPLVLFALFLWFFWTAFLKAPPVVMQKPAIAAPRDNPLPTDRDERALLAARTLPAFIENLRVPLAPRGGPGSAAYPAATHVLSIKTIDIVAGGFDPDKYIELLNSSKEYIARKLAERLAGADYELLVNHDGDRYLRQLILDSIGEITNTRPLVRDGSPGKAVATYYGSVEILLPDAFSVESRQPK